MNSLPLSTLVNSLILRHIYWENCCLQILRNTEALYSYLGLSTLGKKEFVCIKFDKICQILYKQKKILLSAERPRYAFSASVLRRICRQQFSQ